MVAQKQQKVLSRGEILLSYNQEAHAKVDCLWIEAADVQDACPLIFQRPQSDGRWTCLEEQTFVFCLERHIEGDTMQAAQQKQGGLQEHLIGICALLSVENGSSPRVF